MDMSDMWLCWLWSLSGTTCFPVSTSFTMLEMLWLNFPYKWLTNFPYKMTHQLCVLTCFNYYGFNSSLSFFIIFMLTISSTFIHRHYQQTAHTFSMHLGNQRVWDYAGGKQPTFSLLAVFPCTFFARKYSLFYCR